MLASHALQVADQAAAHTRLPMVQHLYPDPPAGALASSCHSGHPDPQRTCACPDTGEAEATPPVLHKRHHQH